TADFGSTRVVQDRNAPTEDILEEPHPRFWIPRASRRAHRTEPRKVVPPGGFDALRPQRSDKRGRYSEVCDAMIRHELPDTIYIRIVRSTIIEEHAGADGQRAEHEPGSHHPTHIRHPVHALAGSQIHAVMHVLCTLDGKAATRVHGALRTACRSARVEDHQHIFGERASRIRVRGLLRHDVVPPDVAIPGHGGFLRHLHVPVYDDVFD